jgi:hemolysin activation/secretion protein
VLTGPHEYLIGTEVTLADIYKIAGEIQKTYRKDGYFLTSRLFGSRLWSPIADRI